MAAATSGRMVHASLWASSNRTRTGLRGSDMGHRLEVIPGAVDAVLARIGARIPRVDDVDRKILALLVEDGRRTYDDVGRRVSLSAPAVKRRVDRLRKTGALEGFTAVVDHGAMGWNTEALVELFFTPGTQLDEVARILREHPEVV